MKRARGAKRAGRAPTTQAGPFVRGEIHHVRKGKHGARSTKQAIAIGLSKARRAGVKVPRPPATAKANWSAAVPTAVKAVVKDGWVTLHGAVSWRYERVAAERAVRDLQGVRGLTNLITVEQQPVAIDIKSTLEHRFERSALVDARRIAIDVDEARISLRGAARSWTEREEAERLAWTVPGVIDVDNKIAIGTEPTAPE